MKFGVRRKNSSSIKRECGEQYIGTVTEKWGDLFVGDLIASFYKYLLIDFYVPGTILRA